MGAAPAAALTSPWNPLGHCPVIEYVAVQDLLPPVDGDALRLGLGEAEALRLGLGDAEALRLGLADTLQSGWPTRSATSTG